MIRFATGLTVLLFVLGATQARAVTSAIRYATITGTANSPTGSECTGEGYAGQCPSGSCTCVEIPSAVVGKVSGQFGIDGTGTAVVPDVRQWFEDCRRRWRLHAIFWNREFDHHPQRQSVLGDA